MGEKRGLSERKRAMAVWLITGAAGFLGRRLVKILQEKTGETVIGTTRRELDFTNEREIESILEKYQPEILVHTGAVSDTGVCEREPEETSVINVRGTALLAKAAGERKIKMIFTSSDQVYAGSKETEPHRECEILSPQTVYGRQKLLAEESVARNCPEGISLRLTWMYDLPGEFPVRPNFLTRLIHAARTKEELTFSEQEFRGITDVWKTAEKIAACGKLPGGSYNFGSSNERTSFETAKAMMEYLGGNPKLIKPGDFQRNLAICTEKINQAGIFFPNTLDGMKQRLNGEAVSIER